METEDIKSQIERARLFETLPGQKKDEARTIDNLGKGAEKEALARSMAIAPESGKAAEGRIREGVEKGVREKMAGVMESRESARMEREEAKESEKMGAVREGMIGATRTAEASETETEESEEPSMREQQEQVPNRIDQEGKATARPRLAQKRAPVEQPTAPSSGALKTTLKTLALPLGSGVAAGLMTWWLT